MFWSVQRGKSFQQHLAKSGYSVHFYSRPASRLRSRWPGEQDSMVQWLRDLPKPVGLMTCTDDRSQNVAEACKLAGIQVPDEIAIIGVDNDPLVCGLANPPLSSVALNAFKAGYESARLLHALMDGRSQRDRLIIAEATHVVTRQSTDIFAVDDPEVAAALRYIRQNSRRAIQITDLAQQSTLSQRALQLHFKAVLGKTIHDVINQSRAEHIAQLLLQTKKTISQIADESHFAGGDHISRFFKRHKGMTPGQFRKRFGQEAC
jgi:LacI family transcriptional regulator